MTTFTRADDLRGARFVDTDLAGARFTDASLSRAVMRGVDVQDLDVDSPWLLEPGGVLLVNGIDVAPYVEAELNRLNPGRDRRRAETPEGLRSAWAALERTWAATLDRVARLPAGTVDATVDGEWSFAQTLRHLVFATDLWVGRAVLQGDDPHPLGLAMTEDRDAVAPADAPPYDDVLASRAGRVAMVRDLVATVTPDELDATRANPHDPTHPETVRSCLHVVLGEEWDHHRYAVRDLALLEPRGR